ncbi:hypothetical protein AB0D34_39185 [Streptomyces sp. NPDC048420]|uniref:hypothetical protein n=1 Tax=Streptomyces sp. NPDC048420 TaxID=3155755 RepID=UPI0034273606
MPTRHTPRTTALALLAVLTLPVLAGCNDGQGVRDEGPATNRAAPLVPAENQKAARH